MFEFAKRQYEDFFGQKISDESWAEVVSLYVDSNLDWGVFLRLSVLCPEVLMSIISKNRVLYDLKEMIYEIYKNEFIPADATEVASAAICRIINHFHYEDERRRTADLYFNSDLKGINEVKDFWEEGYGC